MRVLSSELTYAVWKPCATLVQLKRLQGYLLKKPFVPAQVMDSLSHPALLLVDGVSSIGALEFKFDEWKVDMAVTGSQKALSLPTGLALVAASPKVGPTDANLFFRSRLLLTNMSLANPAISCSLTLSKAPPCAGKWQFLRASCRCLLGHDCGAVLCGSMQTVPLIITNILRTVCSLQHVRPWRLRRARP